MTTDDERPSGTGLRAAIEALADEWSARRQQNIGIDSWSAARRLRALLAAHPDAPEDHEGCDCDELCQVGPAAYAAHPDAAAGTTVEECTCSITRRIGVEMGRDHDPTCPSAFDEPADPAAGTGLGEVAK